MSPLLPLPFSGFCCMNYSDGSVSIIYTLTSKAGGRKTASNEDTKIIPFKCTVGCFKESYLVRIHERDTQEGRLVWKRRSTGMGLRRRLGYDQSALCTGMKMPDRSALVCTLSTCLKRKLFTSKGITFTSCTVIEISMSTQSRAQFPDLNCPLI